MGYAIYIFAVQKDSMVVIIFIFHGTKIYQM